MLLGQHVIGSICQPVSPLISNQLLQFWQRYSMTYIYIYTSLIIKGRVLKAQSGLIKFGYGSVVEHPSLASRVSFDKFP